MNSSASGRIYLEPGDLVADMDWRDHRGGKFSLEQSRFGGRLTVIFVCTSPEAPGVARELKRFAAIAGQINDLGCLMLAVSGDPVAANAAAMQRLDLPFSILSDEGFSCGRALGLGRTPAGPLAAPSAESWCTLIVDPGRRVVKRIGAQGAADQALEVLGECTQRAALLTPVPAVAQAPVLIVPDVLDKAHCKRLVAHWETGERFEGGVASGEYGGNVPMKKVKSREDVALPDQGAEAQEILGMFRRRLFPEIKKAYGFQVTRSDTLRLGAYHAADGGHFLAHRDDTTPYSAHRRFAMSLALDNDAYEGGYVKFPEYGPQLFRAGTGSAVVFSVSMLHEVTLVTAGRRMILLAFFFGEAEEVLRKKLAAERRAAEAVPVPA